MKNQEKLVLKQQTERQEERYVTIRLPESTYQAFHCMEDYPVVGPVDKDIASMARREWNAELYPLPEIYKRRPGTPRGKIVGHLLKDSVFYPGVKHKYWVYTPVQYEESCPAHLILFLDGQSYIAPAADPKEIEKAKTMSDLMRAIPSDGEVTLPEEGSHVTDMLDNLIADGKLPPTVAVFVTPGYPGPGEPVYGASKGISNRSVEYDTVSDWNARFLAEELLPIALKGYSISANPDHHTTVGISSSGIAAFAAAWYQNDLFGNVIGASSSFGNIRGGNIWPSVIRTTEEKKQLRACLCVGQYDADIIFGNWVCANYDMASALNYRGYDFRLLITKMGHSMTFLKYLIPQALAWFCHGTEVCGDNCRVIKPVDELLIDL